MMKLEPFLKCSVIESEFSKYPHRPFRVSFDELTDKSELGDETAEVVVYVDKSDVLGDNLCKVQIDNMHPKEAFIRLSYVPENKKKRTFWVPREQIEWH